VNCCFIAKCFRFPAPAICVPRKTGKSKGLNGGWLWASEKDTPQRGNPQRRGWTYSGVQGMQENSSIQTYRNLKAQSDVGPLHSLNHSSCSQKVNHLRSHVGMHISMHTQTLLHTCQFIHSANSKRLLCTSD
jgi:hypothetical protein